MEALARFRAALAFEEAFVEVIDAASPTADYRIPLADWACRVVTAIALEAAGETVSDAPPLTHATAAAWVHQLREHVDRLAADPEVAAYERGDYRALITVMDVDDCALVIATTAVAAAVDLPAADLAARLIRQLVGPAVVDYDRAKELSSFGGPEFWADGDRAEQRYKAFFESDERVLDSLAEVLYAVAT